MRLQQLLSYVRRAVDDYQMINEGDTIAVGISGGKDSLTLLYALAELRRFYPAKFTVKAISVDLGFNTDYSKVLAFCERLNVELEVVRTEIATIVFDIRKESNPCSLCAKLRKGAFNDAAKRLGCNKIAYAHHKDDVIETLLMSLVFEGRIHTFSPVTYLDRTDLTLIRPLIYVNECDVKGFSNIYELPVFKNPCPADGETKREDASRWIKNLNEEAPGVRDRLFHAIRAGVIPQWRMPEGKGTCSEPNEPTESERNS
ncbi:MAG: tRNA 2-thiocytidine biosynthesis protein TtcA [Lachnospiraceae bacterium]|nr:tRNA 2-thiocytidine biosynthesis protein TtcA [Lachnospiraceae bacterium]